MLSTVRKLLLISVLCLIGLTLANQNAFAQDASSGDSSGASSTSGKVPAKGAGKKTSINFEDQLVEGQTQKPELFYLLQQRNNNFKRLIRLRENFLPEMRKTSEEIGRSGKGSGQ